MIFLIINIFQVITQAQVKWNFRLQLVIQIQPWNLHLLHAQQEPLDSISLQKMNPVDVQPTTNLVWTHYRRLTSLLQRPRRRQRRLQLPHRNLHTKTITKFAHVYFLWRSNGLKIWLPLPACHFGIRYLFMLFRGENPFVYDQNLDESVLILVLNAKFLIIFGWFFVMRLSGSRSIDDISDQLYMAIVNIREGLMKQTIL